MSNLRRLNCYIDKKIYEDIHNEAIKRKLSFYKILRERLGKEPISIPLIDKAINLDGGKRSGRGAYGSLGRVPRRLSTEERIYLMRAFKGCTFSSVYVGTLLLSKEYIGKRIKLIPHILEESEVIFCGK